MFLSSKQIKKLVQKKEIDISPFELKNLKGASYTFTLGSKVKRLKDESIIDSREKPVFEELQITDTGYELKSGDFAIFFTKEKITLNKKYVCLLSTRSTIAQMGLDVTQGSFFAEPDTDNCFALEIKNNGPFSVKLYEGIKIAKGSFSKLDFK